MIEVLLFVAKENEPFKSSFGSFDRSSFRRQSQESTGNKYDRYQSKIESDKTKERNDGIKKERYRELGENYKEAQDNKVSSEGHKGLGEDYKRSGEDYKILGENYKGLGEETENYKGSSEENKLYRDYKGDDGTNKSTVIDDSFQPTSLNDIFSKLLDNLKQRLDKDNSLSQEEFLIWSVDDNALVEPFRELLFEVCHVSLGLRPHCRHHEHEIVMGWLEREERRGFRVHQFWYLISSEWWQSWLNYMNSPRSSFDHCSCRPDRIAIEEGIVCDESYTSNCTDYTMHSNEFNSNSTESMGDLLSRGDRFVLIFI